MDTDDSGIRRGKGAEIVTSLRPARRS